MSDSDCAKNKTEAKAELHYRSGYRQKGHAYISGNNRKDRYNITDDIQGGLNKLRFKRAIEGGQGSIAHAERYYFTYKPKLSNRKRNFTHYQVPYYHQAHHLLPQEFWREMTQEQKKILRQIKYSINNGENIIFLPSDDRGQTIHQLPLHKGSHPKYNEAVIGDAKEIKKDIQDAVEKAEECQSNKPSDKITERLMKLQGDYWGLLIKSDVGHVNEVAIEAPDTHDQSDI